MVSMVTAELSAEFPAVEVAGARALGERVCSADVIGNILARASEPLRTITIKTLDALRLHQPGRRLISLTSEFDAASAVLGYGNCLNATSATPF